MMVLLGRVTWVRQEVLTGKLMSVHCSISSEAGCEKIKFLVRGGHSDAMTVVF